MYKLRQIKIKDIAILMVIFGMNYLKANAQLPYLKSNLSDGLMVDPIQICNQIAKVENRDSIVTNDSASVFNAPEVIVQSTKSNTIYGKTIFPLSVVSNREILLKNASDVSEALSDEPGIAMARDGIWENTVSIRGLSRYNIVSMVDNSRIETAMDLAGPLSLIDQFDIDHIEVIKGANSVLVGTGAFGGAVNVITKQPAFKDQGYFGGESALKYESVNNSFVTHLAMDGESDMLGIRASGIYTKANNYYTPAGVMPNSQFMNFGFTLAGVLKLSTDQLISASYQRFQVENAGIPGGSGVFAPSAVAKYTLARRELGKIEYSFHGLSSFVKSMKITGWEQVVFRSVQIIQSQKLIMTPHARHNTIGTQLDLSLTLSKRHFISCGIDIWKRDLDSKRERYLLDSKSMIEERPLPVSSFASAGLFIQDEYLLVPEKTTIVIGTRIDLISVHNDPAVDTLFVVNSRGETTIPQNAWAQWLANTTRAVNWSANFGMTQSIFDGLDLSFLFSTGFRAPSLEERFQYINNGGYVRVGNPFLKPEQSRSFDAGLKLVQGFGLVKVDMYYNLLEDLVSETLGTFQGNPAYVKVNIGKARIYGYEMSFHGTIAEKCLLDAGLSYVRGEDTRNHVNLPQIPPLSGIVALSHVLNSLGTFSEEVKIVADKKQVSINEAQLPGYYVVNLRFVSKPIVFKSKRIVINSGVENLFNRAYVNFLSTMRGIVLSEPGRNFYTTLSINL